MISGVLINPPETDVLKGGWQGTEAQSTQGSLWVQERKPWWEKWALNVPLLSDRRQGWSWESPEQPEELRDGTYTRSVCLDREREKNQLHWATSAQTLNRQKHGKELV